MGTNTFRLRSKRHGRRQRIALATRREQPIINETRRATPLLESRRGHPISNAARSSDAFLALSGTPIDRLTARPRRVYAAGMGRENKNLERTFPVGYETAHARPLLLYRVPAVNKKGRIALQGSSYPWDKELETATSPGLKTETTKSSM